jgi:hypothetical protein
MKFHFSFRFMKVHILFLATSLFGLFFLSTGSRPLQAQNREEAQKREVWRKEMTRKGLPKKGCFTANYPDTSWHEVACLPPSPYPNPPQTFDRKQPNTVGNTSGDWRAQTAGTISSSTGSFLSVNGAASADNFMLQINTQRFNTSVCAGHVGCLGWQQFLYSPTQCGGGCTFMEYWLVNYGATCPAGSWISYGGVHCWFNGPSTAVGALTIANLPNMILTGTATGGGQDSVVFSSGGPNLTAVGQDSVLNLAGAWNTSEFIECGDCCGKQSNFSNPTTLVVKNTINDGTSNAPSCAPGSTTGETNNLNLAFLPSPPNPPNTLVCCPYGGANPAIEFMETNAGHTAYCGPTQIVGDPHITTTDGTHYDFQAAGEFISLRSPDGMEIQTRQAPIATTFFPGPDPHDGLATCVSLNSAVAARVGKHRVTYEPDLSGVPNPAGLQLRVDGALANAGPAGMDLGDGARLIHSSPGGELEIDFSNGRTLYVTPQWWDSQQKWYLNVDVTHLGLTDLGATPTINAMAAMVSPGPSLGGIAGPIPADSWLPALPNGASLGPLPAAIQDRYNALYYKFADAWRVTDHDSLFDYAPGSSTATFTMRKWPPQQPPCTLPQTHPVEPASLELAKAACRQVLDAKNQADCIFDVRATGDVGFAKLYLNTQRVMADSTTLSLTGEPNPSQAGEWVTFTAYLAASSTTALGWPSGGVQFAADGINQGEPLTVDARGRAVWQTSRLRVGKHRITATFLPAMDSSALPSSAETWHTVRRCSCDADRDMDDARDHDKDRDRARDRENR